MQLRNRGKAASLEKAKATVEVKEMNIKPKPQQTTEKKDDQPFATVNMRSLNRVNILKEVFLAFLNAAVLEPVLALGGYSDLNTEEIIMHVLTLGAIISWIYLLTDAFNYEDVMQFYKYHEEYREDGEYDFIDFANKKEDQRKARKQINGKSLTDLILGFNFLVIGLVFSPEHGKLCRPGAVHAFCIVIMWAVFHHHCRQATSWGHGYHYTFIFPSAALMPMEYCIPLMDVADTVEDLEFVESYIKFVKERTGIKIKLSF